MRSGNFRLLVQDIERDSIQRVIEVQPNPAGLGVSFSGYGEKTALDGHGAPIWIEFRGGIPYVIIWADINQEDPTHEISLAGAAESLRRE